MAMGGRRATSPRSTACMSSLASIQVLVVRAMVWAGAFATFGVYSLGGPPAWWTLLPAVVVNVVGVALACFWKQVPAQRVVLAGACGFMLVVATYSMVPLMSEELLSDRAHAVAVVGAS